MVAAAPLLLALALALLAPAAASAQAQSPAQQTCANELAKRAAGVGKTVGKQGVGCHRALSREQLVGPSFRQCVDGDAAGKVAKAAAKLARGRDKRCDGADLPTLVFAAVDVAAAAQAVAEQTRSLQEDVLAVPAVIVRQAGDRVAARCQAEVVKRAAKLHDVAWKEMVLATKGALAAGAASETDLEAAFGAAWDASAKLARGALQMQARVAKRCATVSIGGVFQGRCARATYDALVVCVAERVRCRACLAAELAMGVALDCDGLDDGAADLSCSLF